MAKRTVVVTGSSSGIGASLAKMIAEPNTQLVLHARGNADGLEKIADACRQKGSSVATILGDLANEKAAIDIVDKAVDEFGGFDAVVANAGFPLFKNLDEGTIGDLEHAFRVNLFSLYSLVKAGRPHLARSGAGRIVAVGSFTAHAFYNGIPHYPMSAPSKGAVEVAIKAIAADLACQNILANCVAPGEINSNATEVSDRRKIVQARIPLGRLGTAEEVAHAIEFLISPRCSYITGQVLHVNGGLFM